MRIALALALAALAACQRPRPSPEYQEARERHAALIHRSPLDAYAQPEMTAVLELLERVPRDSLDAEPAAALRQRILDERQAAAEEQARRARLVEGAGGATPDVGGSMPAAADLPAPSEAPAATAPARPPSELAAGTALEEFQRSHGDCFEAKAAARIGQREGKPVDGVAWGLREDEACRRRNPAEVGRVVLFAGGKLLEVREAGEAKAEKATRTIEGIRRPDGTVALPEGTKLPPGATVRWEPPPAGAQPPVTRR